MTDPLPIPFSKPLITAEDIRAVTEVLESGWLTTGKVAAQFELELAEFVGAEHVITCSSCTTAEEIVLAYLGVGPGQRVAVPTWTFVSTALAVERFGATPIFVDIDPDTLNMSPESLAKTLEAGVDAVVVVHFGGVPVAKEIYELCEAAGVPIIEDAAHALGASDHRGMISGKGTAGACFSFYATKNLSTAEGGAIATDDLRLAKFAREYRLHGMSADAINRYERPGDHSYDVSVPGIKANFPDVLAALGRSQLARFEESQRQRRKLVESYRAGMRDLDVRIVPTDHVEGSADHLFVIDAGSQKRRDAILRALTDEAIGTSVHFRPLHTFTWYWSKEDLIGPGGVDTASRLDGQILSLPLHMHISEPLIDRICAMIESGLAGTA